jgi:hypothetical protein
MMLASMRLRRPVEAPSRLQLAIGEWQRQLIKMAALTPAGRQTANDAELTTGDG